VDGDQLLAVARDEQGCTRPALDQPDGPDPAADAGRRDPASADDRDAVDDTVAGEPPKRLDGEQVAKAIAIATVRSSALESRGRFNGADCLIYLPRRRSVGFYIRLIEPPLRAL
jgi:hypothetical protein